MAADIYRIIEKTKTYAGLTLAQALDGLPPTGYTERELADAWLKRLDADPDLYPQGWYDPPPRGVISLFGKPIDAYQRICQSSFRPPPMWPSDASCNDDDIITIYASPVHRSTNLIGDFGLNLYRGGNAEIHQHFENVLRATLYIAAQTKVGMPFREIYAMAMDYGAAQGFANNIASPTDKTGTNVGHTIPLSFAQDPTHAAVAQATNFADIKQALSAGRKFLNGQEEQRVESDMAFTIEPRFSTATLPNTWFHLTVIFEQGNRRICHGMTPVMQKFSMHRLAKLLPG